MLEHQDLSSAHFAGMSENHVLPTLIHTPQALHIKNPPYLGADVNTPERKGEIKRETNRDKRLLSRCFHQRNFFHRRHLDILLITFLSFVFH